MFRLGANHALIPVNKEPFPILSERDGSSRMDDNSGDAPNYYPNSDLLNQPFLYEITKSPFLFSSSDIVFSLKDTLEQQYQHARESYRSLSIFERDHLHQNLAFALSQITKNMILNRMMDHLYKINPLFAEGVDAALQRLRMYSSDIIA